MISEINEHKFDISQEDIEEIYDLLYHEEFNKKLKRSKKKMARFLEIVVQLHEELINQKNLDSWLEMMIKDMDHLMVAIQPIKAELKKRKYSMFKDNKGRKIMKGKLDYLLHRMFWYMLNIIDNPKMPTLGDEKRSELISDCFGKDIPKEENFYQIF
eukprot:UN04166